jgi:parallel beta-helix repeat protein
MYDSNSGSTVTNCTFTGNWLRAGLGSGMYNVNGSPVITSCTFSGNWVGFGGGGGMYNSSGSPMITNCTFRGNSVFDGSDSPIYGGGGITNHYGQGMVVTGCTFSENSVSYDIGSGGGGINNLSGMEVTNCTFSGNTCFGGAGGGGGICNQGIVTITGCTFSGNTAAGYGFGGGIYSGMNAGRLSVTNCTFVGNRANNNSGGIYIMDSLFPNVMNCILWANEGEQIVDDTNSASVAYSDIQGGWPGTGNIDTDPCFVAPGYWDANGTPGDTNDDFWVDGDYHLKSEGWRWDRDANQWTWDDVTSRCIDAGNPGSPLGDEPLTLAVDPLNRWGKNLRIDMGAYGGTAEASMPPYGWALLADLTNDGVVNLEDFAVQAENWLENGSEQPGDLNRDGVVDINDLAMFGEDWLKQTSWSQ